MATATFNAIPSNGTDALFRAWGKGLSDALAAIGMVKTADTGQINWATVTAPTGATQQGYEVWRFDDALQATAPLFFRLDYGSGASAGTGVTGFMPTLWVTIGKGSNGSGAITGVLLAETKLGDIGTSGIYYPTSLDTMPCFVSTCPGKACVTVMMFCPTTGAFTRNTPAFVIERSRDSNGQAIAEGLMFARGFGVRSSSAVTSGPNSVRVINYDSGVYNDGAPPVNLPATINGSAVSGASSLTQPIAPVFPWVLFTPGGTPWQSLAAVSYLAGDAMPGPSTVRLFGEDRTFRIVAPLTQHGWAVMVAPNLAASGSSTTMAHAGIAVLWEDD